MPFIVTTKDTTAVARGIGHQARFTKIVERWAVATLEEVKALVGPEATRAAAAMSIPEPDGTTTFPGGTITLSDGRTIEVVAVDDAEYARAIDAGMNGPAVPGVAEGRPMRSELERIEQALDAQRQTLSHLTLPLLDEALALVRGLLAEPDEDPGVEGKNARWWADNAAYWHDQADQYKLWRDEAMRDVADLKQQLRGDQRSGEGEESREP
jgi:hypothetical protein